MVDEAPATSVHSSSSLSPPQSPTSDDNIRVATAHLPGGVAAAAHPPPTTAAMSAAMSNGTNTTVTPNTEKPKRQRKKKDPAALGPDGKPVVEVKEKKPRKPREPKDKTLAATTTARKKIKPEHKPIHDAARQPTITEMVHSFSAPASAPVATTVQQPHGPPPSTTTTTTTTTTLSLPSSNPSTSRPISSGQKYDPIRGYDPVRSIATDPVPSRSPTTNPAFTQPSPHPRRSIDPTDIRNLLTAPGESQPKPSPVPSLPSHLQQPFVPSQPLASSPPRTLPFTVAPPTPQAGASSSVTPAERTDMHNVGNAMYMDLACDADPLPALPEVKMSSKSSSGAPTPKAARPTPPPPPPKGTGSGLLSSSDLFGGPSVNGDGKRKGVDIDFRIPLKPGGGNTINIAQEILKRYGRDAINPRVAAHREELLRVAAEANKLEGGLNDDMSLDEMSDPDADSNVEMGGMEDEKSVTGTDNKPVRKRRKKVEEYDKEDDFIDDAELAWQERAAVAKDGFFVYSGPLVPVGQDAQIESSAPARGSRGRGRGRGSRGGATAGATHASVAAKKAVTATAAASASEDPSAPPTRARARARATGAPRKPRITKLEREKMEAEKLSRERTMFTLGGPTGGPIALNSTTTTTTMAPSTTPHIYPPPMGSTTA